MTIAWVAASVRSQALARRRLGRAAVRRLENERTLAGATALLADGAYAQAAQAGDLATAQRAIAKGLLWDIRVLAGWMPSSGTPIARAVVAAFERENCVNHLRRLSGATVPDPFELGSLSTAWHRVRTAASPREAADALAASRWGAVATDDPATCRDAMAAAWLRRVVVDVPGAEALAVPAAGVLVARARLVDGVDLGVRATTDLNAVLGSRWARAGSLDELREALAHGAGGILDGVTGATGLWVAEMALRRRLAELGDRLLRDPLPGPRPVVGVIALLAADALDVQAALATAAMGGSVEVLDGVA